MEDGREVVPDTEKNNRKSGWNSKEKEATRRNVLDESERSN